MASKKDVTVYIGRFNPFHLGHAHVLEAAIKTSELVVVLVGSSGQARSLKNPFSFDERERVILNWASAKGYDNLVVLPLRDYPYNDTRWIESVQEQVKRAMTSHCARSNTILTDVYLTGSDRDESTWYLQSFPQWKLDLKPEFVRPSNLKVSATSVREIMYGMTTQADELPYSESFIRSGLQNKVPPSTAAFLAEFMKTEACALLRREWDFIREYKKAWSVAPYEPVFVTTDAVVVQSGHVLVVTRGAFPGEGLWALPGGFLDPKERLQSCAVREVMEETGIRLAEGKRAEEITRAMLLSSIKDKEIFDKPDRSSRGRTVTTAFLMQLDDTKPLPKVKGMNMPLSETGGKVIAETYKAFWLPVSEALTRTDQWFEDHLSILEWGVSRLQPR